MKGEDEISGEGALARVQHRSSKPKKAAKATKPGSTAPLDPVLMRDAYPKPR